MKPCELYEMTPEKIDKGIEGISGCYYNHIPEATGDFSCLMYEPGIFDRVTMKTIKYFNFDGRRFWLLATVWFDDKPVMVVQNAGREGDDHSARFITDSKLFACMVRYIDEQCAKQTEISVDVFDANIDVPNIDNFYGYNLKGAFERHRY